MHQSVLLNEVLEWLDPRPGSTVVDGTLGAAGHAGAILERLGAQGKLIGFDKDPLALEEAQKILTRFGEKVMLIQDDFRNLTVQLRQRQIHGVDGLLLDLGVSSMQLDHPGRGFSFQTEGPLDMRMNPAQPLTAREIINTYPKNRLQEILWNYGEERFARRIAERIVDTRSKRRIETTVELESIIYQAVPAFYRHGRIHPATRSFQALRIAVNDEVKVLQELLAQAVALLNSHGRMVVISFHSLEDREIKTAFKRFSEEKKGRILTKKPVTPGLREIDENPRSRSAKLRAFEKL